MAQFAGYYLFFLAFCLIVLMVWQHRRGVVELVSIRNMAILGFIVFQLTSAALRLTSSEFGLMKISSPDSTGVTYALMATVFLPLALLSYKVAPGVRAPARLLARRKAEAGDGFLLLLAALLTAAALVMRFGVLIPYVAIYTNLVGVGFAAVACGLGGWVWARRFSNPMVLLTLLLLVAVNGAIVMWGEFGRRNLVAVSAAVIWGMYYSAWRYMSGWKLLVRATAIGAIPLVFIALFTSVRTSADGGRNVVDHLIAMKDGSVIEGTALLLEGQATGTVSLWCIENFPENYEYDHLFTIQYFFILPIPRAIWETKPTPLSTKVASRANVRGVDQGKVTLPAGILGNAAAEGGWYALIIYALISGVFLRFFDELIRQNPWSPFVVLPVGCQLGQVLGLARGETALFANTYVLAFIGVWITMSLTAKLLDAMGVSRDAGAFADAGEEQNWTAYGDEAWLAAQGEQSGDHAA
jgi:hypothetical protein